MKVIVAGSRDLSRELHSGIVRWAAEEFGRDHGEITRVLCGGCRGGDQFGQEWAISKGIPVDVYLPDWHAYGRAAGPRRNEQMAVNADGLVVVRFEDSRGSEDILSRMQQRGLPIVDVAFRMHTRSLNRR
jgi:hypothetical protein